ncbi:OmpA family protein [Maribacter sp. PR1]|uniref:OmpA family protein n=1 Tax=Maribacter cobaltidurans TaxID=1178778 RepID=A0ABU7IR42_9FLAO|nr:MULTISPECIES: OmpA family protein [Maribacter]MDC6388038.1 OmpA family protein [Maribacter sp. PR1]MEE1975426.1 OmpA family protein [Maribacter cobaltidurans]
MSKTTTNLLLMLITILAGTYFYISYCSECATTVIKEPPRESVTIEQPESTSYPFAIRDGDFYYKVNDNYNFNVSSSSILLPTSEEELSALFDKIKEKPLVLYFNTAEASINFDQEQRQKVADMHRYIDKVENATISIVGHTENTGQVDTKLGLDRANFAQDYLMSNGISAEKINTSSKGQSEPIAEKKITLRKGSPKIGKP